jgi:CDP-paratose 2-epimerase
MGVSSLLSYQYPTRLEVAMNILITGGAGFVGSNLALAIKHRWPNAKILALDNLYRRGSELNVPRLRAVGVEFVQGDVRVSETFPPGPFDFLIECSAEPSVLAGHNESPDYCFHTNLVGAYNCLEKARVWKSRLIFLSTSRVYPIAPLESHPWHEQATRFVWEDKGTSGVSVRGVAEEIQMEGARSLYGFTKFAGEQLIEEYRAAYALQAIVNRCGVIAGPWQFGKIDQGVLALWVMAHHFGKPLTYVGYGGSGKQVRDFLHVDDLCELLCEQIDNFSSWEGWLGNVSGGYANSASLNELTVLCREILDREVPISSNPETRPWDLRIFIGDCSRLFSRTSWRPKKSLEEVIKDTANWISRHEKELAAIYS